MNKNQIITAVSRASRLSISGAVHERATSQRTKECDVDSKCYMPNFLNNALIQISLNGGRRHWRRGPAASGIQSWSAIGALRLFKVYISKRGISAEAN
jgi:hypothetical protein